MWNSRALLKYCVGRVSSNAHVDAIGNTLVELNLRVRGKVKPNGGIDSAPVENERTFSKLTLVSDSPITHTYLALTLK